MNRTVATLEILIRLPQTDPHTGMPAYYLPMETDAKKDWGTPTDNFWCCHGSVVQANTIHGGYLYYQDEEGVSISQYFASELSWEWNMTTVKIKQIMDTQAGNSQYVVSLDSGKASRPSSFKIDLSINCECPEQFTLKLRIPWWVSGTPSITINGEQMAAEARPSSYVSIRRVWHKDTICIEFPKALTACPLSDQPNMVAFMDGPIVLAGLIDQEKMLYGDINLPATLLRPIDERHWIHWQSEYYTHNQDQNFRFKPLYMVTDERYTVYFPVRSCRPAFF